MNNNRTFAGGYQPKPLPPGTTMGTPPKEPACPANPAPQGEQQQQESSSDGQSRSSGHSQSCTQIIGAPSRLKGLEAFPPNPMDRLIAALEAQTKAIEEYAKATKEQSTNIANVAIHIGLLIQAMAEDQDDGGDGPNLRTLG